MKPTFAAHQKAQDDAAEREHRIEKAWPDNRDELIDSLAKGEPLKPNGKTLLDFSDVASRLAFDHSAALDACLMLSATNPELAGRHMQGLVRQACEELVGLFGSGLKTDIDDSERQAA